MTDGAEYEIGTIEGEIRQELREQWIYAVGVKEQTPREACSELGIPYPLMLAYKDSDPQIAALWEFGSQRKSRKAALEAATPQTFRDVQEIQSHFTRDLFERSGLGKKIARYVEKIDPETDEGEQKIEKLIKFGFLKQVLPNQSVTHESKTRSQKDELEAMSTEELAEELTDRFSAIKQLEEESRRAQEARRKAASLTEPKADDA